MLHISERPSLLNCPGWRTKAATEADSSPTQVDSFRANVAVHRHECCAVMGKQSLSSTASRPAGSIDRLFRRNKLKTVTFGAFPILIQDHLARIYSGLLGEVDCRRIACRERCLCDECEGLGFRPPTTSAATASR